MEKSPIQCISCFKPMKTSNELACHQLDKCNALLSISPVAELGECCICRNYILGMAGVVEPCKHSSFCYKCVQSYILEDRKCPMCGVSVTKLTRKVQ